jgi:hypothetical protein
MSTPSSIICNFIFLPLGYRKIFKKEIIFNFSKSRSCPACLARPAFGLLHLRSFYEEVNFRSKIEVSLLFKKLITESVSGDLRKNNYSNINLHKFRLLANGVFQTKGYIGEYFLYPYQNLIKFRPLVSIAITATYESIFFLVFLNKQLDFQMRYIIDSLPSGLIYVKLYSTD